MSSNAQRILDERDIVIQLIRAINTDNMPFYAYVMMKADKWKNIEKRMHNENIDFSKEGKILAGGMGHEPDVIHKATIEAIIQKIKDGLE